MGRRLLLFLIRTLLIPLLWLDFLIGCKLILLSFSGGNAGVDRWIRHVALAGRLWIGTSIAQREVWVRQASFFVCCS